MLYLFDNNKTLIATVAKPDTLESSQEQILNGLITAKVTFRYIPEADQAQFFGAKDIDDSSIFWMYKVDRQEKADGTASMSGTYVLFDDLNGRGIIEDRRPVNEGASTVLTDILAGTGWTVGNVTTSHKGTSNYYFSSKLAAFWDFLEKWRVEYTPRITMAGSTITGRYIDITDQRSQDYGKLYEYGSNLLTITAEKTAVPFTAYIGRGKGEASGDGFGRRITFEDVVWTTPTNPAAKPAGQKWVADPIGTALYGYEGGAPRIGTVEFPDIDDPAALLDATWEHTLANSRPQVQFKSSVVETGRAEVGETVTILRDALGIRYKTRIFKYSRNFLTGKVRSIEFGDQVEVTSAQRAKEMTATAKEKEIESIDLLRALREAITAAYFNEDGYNYDLAAGNEYGLPGGYYSFNAPIDGSPTRVIYQGAGKLLIANSKNAANEWAWRTAMDGDGIIADVITTGILNASLITAGILQGGKVRWDLDTGVFYIGNSSTDYSLKWDGSNLYIKGDNIDLSANNAVTSKVSTITYNNEKVVQGTTAPASPITGKLWLNTSLTPNALMRWSGTTWVKASAQTASDVGAYLTTQTYTKTETSNAVKMEFANTPIGGRNLAKDSGKDISTSAYNLISSWLYEDWVEGEWYTVSLKGTKTAPQTFGLWRDGGSRNVTTNIPYDPIRDIYTHTFQCPAIYPGATPKQYSIYQYPSGTSGPATIKWVKIEKGKVPTDWTPAPEELKGQSYSFDGESFKIGGMLAGDKAEHTNTYSKYTHTDGSYTQMGVNGLERFVFGTGQKYHYLIHVMTFIQGESGTVRWLQLPNEFKGKAFSIYMAMADSMTSTSYKHAIQRFVATKHDGYAIDYANARVPIVAYKTMVDMVTPFDGTISTIQGMLIAIV